MEVHLANDGDVFCVDMTIAVEIPCLDLSRRREQCTKPLFFESVPHFFRDVGGSIPHFLRMESDLSCRFVVSKLRVHGVCIPSRFPVSWDAETATGPELVLAYGSDCLTNKEIVDFSAVARIWWILARCSRLRRDPLRLTLGKSHHLHWSQSGTCRTSKYNLLEGSLSAVTFFRVDFGEPALEFVSLSALGTSPSYLHSSPCLCDFRCV